LSQDNILKYGYGLLSLTKDELYSMDCFDFLERVEGALLWQEQKDDTMLNWIAWFTANQMMSTGNMKKGTDALKIKKGLYQSAEDVAEEKDNTQDKKKKDADAERDKLKARFNL
jgi:hypothetical protein